MGIETQDYTQFITNLVQMNKTLEELNKATERDLGRLVDAVNVGYGKIITKLESNDESMNRLHRVQYGLVAILVAILVTLIRGQRP